MAKQRVEIDEEIARHPHLLQIEWIVRIAPLMTETVCVQAKRLRSRDAAPT